MTRTLLTAMLLVAVACAGKKDEPAATKEAATGSGATTGGGGAGDKIGSKGVASGLLERAIAMLDSPDPSPRSMTAIARALEARGRKAEARQYLDRAVAGLERAFNASYALPISAAADALVAFGDEPAGKAMIARLLPELTGEELDAEHLVRALASLESPVLRNQLFDALRAHSDGLAAIAELGGHRIIPGHAAWEGMVEVARQRADLDGRAGGLAALAALARQSGHPEVARALLDEAAQVASKGELFLGGFAVATELAIQGDREAAIALARRSAASATGGKRTAVDRVMAQAQLAAVHALAGDTAGSAAADKRALAEAAKVADELARYVPIGHTVGGAMWGTLAFARARRGDLEGAQKLLAERLRSAEQAEQHSEVALRLADDGAWSEALAIARTVPIVHEQHIDFATDTDQIKQDTIASLVDLHLLAGRRDQAVALVRSEGAGYQGRTLETLLSDHGRRGDLAAIHAVSDIETSGFYTQTVAREAAARALARDGKCTEAAAAVQPGRGKVDDVTLSTIARHCPDL